MIHGARRAPATASLPFTPSWCYAFEHDLVVVTSNAGDFLRLAEGVELHTGLIVLRAGHLTRDERSL